MTKAETQKAFEEACKSAKRLTDVSVQRAISALEPTEGLQWRVWSLLRMRGYARHSCRKAIGWAELITREKVKNSDQIDKSVEQVLNAWSEAQATHDKVWTKLNHTFADTILDKLRAYRHQFAETTPLCLETINMDDPSFPPLAASLMDDDHIEELFILFRERMDFRIVALEVSSWKTESWADDTKLAALQRERTSAHGVRGLDDHLHRLITETPIGATIKGEFINSFIYTPAILKAVESPKAMFKLEGSKLSGTLLKANDLELLKKSQNQKLAGWI
jgi:hypothetical protein